MLWNHNNLLLFRFQLQKCFGSSTVFLQRKICTKSCLFNFLSEAELFLIKLASHLLWFITVPVPTSEKFRFRIQTISNRVFQQRKICTKSCLFNVRSKTVSQKVCLSFFIFWLWYSTYFLPRSKKRRRNHSGSVPLRQKVAFPAVPVLHSTTLLLCLQYRTYLLSNLSIKMITGTR